MLFMADGDAFSRCEVFDEADLDAALARFDELNRPAARLENSATRAVETSAAYFAARDWSGMAELLAEDVFSEDRRSVVNYGIRRGRETELTNWQATADVWTDSARSTLAIRGQRLGLFRFVFYTHDESPGAFSAEALAVVEVDGDNRIAKILIVEPDDFDSAVKELDRWYLAGEQPSTRARGRLSRKPVPHSAEAKCLQPRTTLWISTTVSSLRLALVI